MCTSNNIEGLNITPVNQDNGKTPATNVAEGGAGNLWTAPTDRPVPPPRSIPTATPTQVNEMASTIQKTGQEITYGAPAAEFGAGTTPTGGGGTAALGSAVPLVKEGAELAAGETTGEAVKAAGEASKAMSNVAFGVGAALILLDANNAKKSAKGQAANIKANLASQVAIAKNREGLENLQLRDTLDQINTKALKTRSSFQAAKGENLGGATYNAMLADFRRNELNMRERVVDQVTQNRIQVRENIMVTYSQALRDIDQLNDSVPSYAEVALKLALTAVSAYATGGASLAAGVGAAMV